MAALTEQEKEEFDSITADQIDSCKDVKKLLRLEKYMCEGGYTPTADRVHARLRELGTRAQLETVDPEVARTQADELKRARAELLAWEKAQKQAASQPDSVGARDTSASATAYPPVRHSVPAATTSSGNSSVAFQSVPAVAPVQNEPKLDSKVGGGMLRSGKDYYQKWDKLADQLVQEVEQDEAESGEPVAVRSSSAASSKPVPPVPAAASGPSAAVLAAAAASSAGGAALSGPARTARLVALNRDLPSAERDYVAGQERSKGNEQFRAKEYAEAVEHYTVAIQLRSTPDATLHANRSAAYIKLRLWEEADLDATEAIDLDPNSIKAYLRRAAARLELGRIPEAIVDCESILELQPDCKEAADMKANMEQKLQLKAMKRMAIEEVEEDEEEEEEGVAIDGDALPASERPAFIAAANFAGARPGYAFRSGPQGLGYYPDAAHGAPQAASSSDGSSSSSSTHATQSAQPAQDEAGSSGRAKLQVVEEDSDSSDEEQEAVAEAAAASSGASVEPSADDGASKAQPAEAHDTWGSGGTSPKDGEPADAPAASSAGEGAAAVAPAPPATVPQPATRTKIPVVVADSESEDEEPPVAPAQPTTAAAKAGPAPLAAAAAAPAAAGASAPLPPVQLPPRPALPAAPTAAEYDAVVTAQKDQGNAAFKAGNFVQAAQLYGEAIKLAPDSSVLYLNRCMARLRSNLPVEALGDACTAVALDRSSWKALAKRGTAKSALKLWRSAAADLRQCLAMSTLPSNDGGRTRMDLQRELQQAEAAEAAAEQRAAARAEAAAAAAKRNKVTNYKRVGVVIEEHNDEDDKGDEQDQPLVAESDMERQQEAAADMVGELRMQGSKLREAWLQERTVALQEQHERDLCAWQASCKQVQAAADAAAEVAAAAAAAATPTAAPPEQPASGVEAAPAAAAAASTSEAADQFAGLSGDAIKEQGNQHLKAKRYAEAQACYAACLAQEAANLPVHLNMALLLNDVGDYAGAERHASFVLKLEPGNVKALHRRGIARKLQGQLHAALEDLRQAKAKLGQSPQLDAEMADIGTLLAAQQPQAAQACGAAAVPQVQQVQQAVAASSEPSAALEPRPVRAAPAPPQVAVSAEASPQSAPAALDLPPAAASAASVGGAAAEPAAASAGSVAEAAASAAEPSVSAAEPAELTPAPAGSAADPAEPAVSAAEPAEPAPALAGLAAEPPGLAAAAAHPQPSSTGSRQKVQIVEEVDEDDSEDGEGSGTQHPATAPAPVADAAASVTPLSVAVPASDKAASSAGPKSMAAPVQAAAQPAAPEPAVAAAPDPAAIQEGARLREQGNKLYQAGNYIRALDIYSSSIKACGHNPPAFCNRALLLLQLGRPADALADCDTALRQQPGYQKARLRRGMALRDLKRYAEAAECLQSLLDGVPGDQHVLDLVQEVQRLAAGAPSAANATVRYSQQLQLNRSTVPAPVPAVQPTLGPASASMPAAQQAPAPAPASRKIVIEEDSGSDSDDVQQSQQPTTSSSKSRVMAAPQPSSSGAAPKAQPVAPSSSTAAAPSKATVNEAAVSSSRLHQSASALAAAALASRTPKQPAPPRSAHDFEQAVKSLAGHPAVLRSYVLSMDPANYAPVFKSNLTDKSLSLIVGCFKDALAEAPAEGQAREQLLKRAASALEGLTKVPRFEMMYRLAIRQAKPDVQAVVSTLGAGGVEVSGLHAVYKL